MTPQQLNILKRILRCVENPMQCEYTGFTLDQALSRLTQDCREILAIEESLQQL